MTGISREIALNCFVRLSTIRLNGDLRISTTCCQARSSEMPNNVNAEKALRQNIKRRLRNRSQMSALRTVIKKARMALEPATPDAAAVGVALREVTKKLDQAAAKGLIHRNAAARTKSRLVHQQKKKLGTGAPAAN